MKTGVVTFIVMLSLSTSANAQAPTAGELAVQRELVELRAELKSLRTDIQTLVQSLKPAAPQSANSPVTQPIAEPSAPLLAAAPDKMYLPSRAQNPNREPRLEIEERPFVELTLDQCIEMALHHVSRSAKPEANASSKAKITYDTKVAFWQ